MKKTKKLTEWAVRFFTPKSLSFLLTLLYLVSLIPLLLIARYNFPSADDYSEGELCRHVWMETHNILAVIWQAGLKAVDSYLNWQGCFFSIFFRAIQPAVFGEQWYSLTTFIIIGSLSFAIMFLCKSILVKILKIDKYLSRCIAMLTLFVTVQCMVGRVEALYWYNGAINYVFFHSAGMVMLGAMIQAAVAERKSRRVGCLVLASVTGIWVGGGNYMTALDIGIILTAAIAVVLFLKKAKIFRLLLIPTAFFYLAFAASILAPGNQVRASEVTGMGMVKSVMVSFHYAYSYALSEWTNWVVLLMVAVLIPLFWKAAGQTRFSFPYPLLVLLFSFCLLSATMTPPLFAVGNIGAGRLQAVIFITYILLLVLNVGYLTGWAAKRLRGKERRAETGRFTSNTAVVLLSLGIFWAFGTVLCVIPEPHYFTFSSAITDLSNGSAAAYGWALKERAETLNAAGAEEEIILPPLPAKPALLYFGDITTNRDNWENRAVARYYGVTSAVLEDLETKEKP